MGITRKYIGVLVLLAVVLQVNVTIIGATDEIQPKLSMVTGSSNWTVGVEIGSTKTSRVTDCIGL